MRLDQDWRWRRRKRARSPRRAVLESESGTQETTVSLAARESAYCGGADEKCDIRQRRQISKAREIAIGSDLLVMRRYLAVDSIFVWPKSTRTASISPVPFKMWRAFVRRKDSMPKFSGSSPASETHSLSRRLMSYGRKL